MGSLGIETAVAAARDQTIGPVVDTGTEMVTKDNVDQFS
jgi:simple sugar transport system substrate-binding protein